MGSAVRMLHALVMPGAVTVGATVYAICFRTSIIIFNKLLEQLL
jgi:hypothetical protein